MMDDKTKDLKERLDKLFPGYSHLIHVPTPDLDRRTVYMGDNAFGGKDGVFFVGRPMKKEFKGVEVAIYRMSSVLTVALEDDLFSVHCLGSNLDKDDMGRLLDLVAGHLENDVFHESNYFHSNQIDMDIDPTHKDMMTGMLADVLGRHMRHVTVLDFGHDYEAGIKFVVGGSRIGDDMMKGGLLIYLSAVPGFPLADCKFKVANINMTCHDDKEFLEFVEFYEKAVLFKDRLASL